MSFLDQLLEYTKEAESPRSFFLWSGLAAISAVVKRNIWINKGFYSLYPNVYIMLVARSGLRKGYPVKLAQRLVEALETTKVISGRNSIQSIVQELSRQWTLEGGKVLTGAQAFLVNDELGTFLVDDPQAQSILTTLYDSFYHDKWANTLKSEGRSVLKDIYITMLSATNRTHLNAFLDSTSVTGGFIGRTLLVYEEKKSQINSLIWNDEATPLDNRPLIAELRRISEANGQIKLTLPAKKLFDSWYHEFNKKLESEDSLEDDTGTSDRLHDHILKISALLSLSESNDLKIEEAHLARGIELCTGFTTNVKRITAGHGKGDSAEKSRLFLDYLLSQPNFTTKRSKVLSAKYGHIDAIDLDRLVDTMVQAGLLEISGSGGNTIYKLADSYTEQFRQAEKKKAFGGKRVVEL